MKRMQTKFLCGLVLLLGLLNLHADVSTNATVVIHESWETISNRWVTVPIEQIKQAAKTNDVSAQYFLAIAYADGNDVSKDDAESFKWMQLAAQNGLPWAQRKLGWMFQSGQGITNNITQAVQWYQKAEQQGDLQAKINLAWIYGKGVYGEGTVSGQGAEAQTRSGGIAPNHELAENLMRQAVDLNTAEGQYQLGSLIFNEVNNEGHEDTTRFPDAANWFRKAAEQGLADAQYQLAEMYNNGKLGDDQRSNCISWYLKAAAQGNDDAKTEIGELATLYPGNELLKSVKNIEVLQQSAEQGNLDAEYQLARRYQFGIGVPPDPAEAFKWMQKAAQNNTPSSRVGDAIYHLALMYEKGEGTTTNLAEARKLFLSAQLYNVDAAFRVGQMFEKGEGEPQDDKKAVELYGGIFHNPDFPDQVEYVGASNDGIESLLNLWSQGRGFPDAKEKAKHGYHDPGSLINFWQGLIATGKGEFYAGQIYNQGKLVPQDLVEAAARFQIAAGENFYGAKEALAQIEPGFSSDQKAAEKKRFNELQSYFNQAKQIIEATKQANKIMPW